MRRIPFLTAGLSALWAAPALALDMEFYTYGGFSSVVNAFKQVALILSDSGFTGLFFVVAVLGIVFGGIAFFLKMVGGMRLDPVSWTWPIMVGMIIYVAMIVPKGSLTIYDPVLNRFETVGNIPDGVVLVAGTLNKLERGLVEIIDTAAPPGAKYAQGAGGIGFTALKNIMSADIKNGYFKQSLGRYMEDCVLFELTRPGTTLSLDTLVNSNTDYLPELAKAVNPAVYTVYFNAGTPNGTAMTCTDAWTGLHAFMNDPSNYTAAIAATAGKTMFDPDNMAEVAQFRNLLSNTLQETTGINATPEVLARQGIVSRALFQTLQGADPVLAMTVQANRQATTAGIGMMVAANEWLPVVKAVMTTVAIGLIPVLLLFVPTPMLGKALSILVGFFLFLASWGVTDAVVHNASLAAAADTMKEISQSGLALDACLNFPSASTKVLAMFGTIRSGGIMLASMLTMMLVSFGGHALSALAGNLTGQVQSAGASAGALATPEGRSSAKAATVAAAGIEAWTNKNSFGDMAYGDYQQRDFRTQGSLAQRSGYQAAQDRGFGGSEQEWMRAQQSSFTYGGQDGRNSFTLGQDGSVVSSGSDSTHTRNIGGTPDNPATKVQATSLGVFGIKAGEQTEAKATEALQQQDKKTTTAADKAANSLLATGQQYANMRDAVNAAANRGDQSAVGLAEQFSATAKEEEAFANHLQKTHGLSNEAARFLMSNLSLGMSAGIKAEGGGFLGKLVGSLAGVGATGSFGADYNLTAQDREKLSETVNNLSSDDYKQAESIANSRQANMDRASRSTFTTSSGSASEHADGYNASLAESRLAASEYGTQWANQQTMSQNYETAKKSNLMASENLDPQLYGHLVGTFGAQQTNELLSRAAAGDVAATNTLRPAVDQFAEQQAAKILNGPVAAKVAAGREVSADVQDNLKAKQEETQGAGTPAAFYEGARARAQDAATAAGVAPGTQPAPVQTGLGAPTRENFDQLAEQVQQPTRTTVDAGRESLEASRKETTEDFKERKDNTSKGAALLQNAGSEWRGGVAATGRVLTGAGGAINEALTGGPARMEVVRETLSNPANPNSPGHHFGGAPPLPEQTSPGRPNGTATAEPQGKDKDG